MDVRRFKINTAVVNAAVSSVLRCAEFELRRTFLSYANEQKIVAVRTNNLSDINGAFVYGFHAGIDLRAVCKVCISGEYLERHINRVVSFELVGRPDLAVKHESNGADVSISEHDSNFCTDAYVYACFNNDSVCIQRVEKSKSGCRFRLCIFTLRFFGVAGNDRTDNRQKQ